MKDLMDYLPEGYQNSPETAAVQKAIQPELDMIWLARNDLLLQLNPNTATWGLKLWEEALGLSADPGKDLAFRRTRVVSKLRGSGTTTVAQIKNVSESFSNGEVEVEEIFSEYRVEIHFTGTIGVPPNLEDLRDALNEIMPDHLAWEFVFRYRTHQLILPYTHGLLCQFQHQAIREGDLTNE